MTSVISTGSESDEWKKPEDFILYKVENNHETLAKKWQSLKNKLFAVMDRKQKNDMQ